MTEPVPDLVTLHLWRVANQHVPSALARVAFDRRRVRRTPGVRFAKLLGTGRLGAGNGRTFTVRDSDPNRWGLLATWSDPSAAADFERSAPVRGWARIAEETWRVELLPLAARGRWSGRQPFGAPTARQWDGPVAAVTRARLSVSRARAFWRAAPPVSADLRNRAGALLAVGIGEAPVGLQGTFSLWDSAMSLRAFAYRGAPHRDVVRRTAREGWYAEELFARFAVLSAVGTVNGRDPLR